MSFNARKKEIFLKVLVVFQITLVAFFIWENLSPVGLDVTYAVYEDQSQTKKILDVETSIPELFFKDHKHLGSYLMAGWNSIDIALPKEKPKIIPELYFKLNLQDHSKDESLEKGLLLRTYGSAGMLGAAEDSRIVSGVGVSDENGVFRTKANTAYEWLGNLKIEKEGVYLFSLKASENSFLFIDNVLVAYKDQLSLNGKSSQIFLKEGFHSFCLKNSSVRGFGYLSLMWKLEGGETQGFYPIKKSHFFHGSPREILELRSKGLSIDYLKDVQGSLVYDRSDGDRIHTLKFSDVHDLLKVEFYRRGADGSYSKSPRGMFHKPSSRFLGYWSSLFLSLCLSSFITLVLGWFLRRYLGFCNLLSALNIAKLLVLHVFTRLNNISTVPAFQYTFDEYMEAWMGINLIHLGKPSVKSYIVSTLINN